MIESQAQVDPPAGGYLSHTKWTYVDFLILIVAQLVGATIAAIGGVATGSDPLDPDVVFVGLTLLGQALGAGMYLAYMSRTRGTNNWGTDFGLRFDTVKLWAFPLGAALQIAIALVISAIVPPDSLEQGVSDVVASSQGMGQRILIAVLVVVVAPVLEELIFRSVLLSRMVRQFGKWGGIIGSGIAFGVFHLLDASPLVIPGLIVVGMVLAWFAIRHGDLRSAILMHAGFNAVGVVALFAGIGA